MHRSIGGVEIEDDEGLIYHGTAFLLSSDLLLTAAHNVYSRKSKKPYRRLKFYLSTKGVGDHHYEVEAFKFLDEYRNATNSDSYKYDYAVLKLKSGVGYQQYMPLLHPCK
jgi:V8-like Glu-specific endopeptidase